MYVGIGNLDVFTAPKMGYSSLQSLWSLGEAEILHSRRCMWGNAGAIALPSVKDSGSEGSDPERSPSDLTNPSGLVRR